MRRTILILSVLALVVIPALADDSAIKVVGGAVQMLDEHSDVRMVSAVITADVYANESHVRCEYLLKNEGNGQMVTLGFPDMPGRYPGDVIPKAHLEDFHSWVDGERLAVKLHTSAHENGKSFDRWYVRRVWFDAGQTRTIVNTYIQPNGEDSMGGRWFPYTIWPAGSWKGPIGKLDITARWQEPYLWELRKPANGSSMEPHHQVSPGRRTLAWSWTNVEPRREHIGRLHLYFTPGWRRVGVNGISDWGDARGSFFLIDGSLTMAPVRRLAGLLELECTWQDGAATLRDSTGTTFVCRVGSREAVADGEAIRLRSKPMLWTGPKMSRRYAHMYAPLRPICEAFGWRCSLYYDQYAVVLERAEPKPPPAVEESQ